MIAMLQQFFLTPTFRYAILMAEDGQEPNMQPRPKDGVLADDNVFHQFQRMFASLELSDRVDYNPTDFCFAFKDFTGTPVDVTVQ
jgi:ubiquitin carboxyl-terminal hydrolase 34